jgi:hypothetical protein
MLCTVCHGCADEQGNACQRLTHMCATQVGFFGRFFSFLSLPEGLRAQNKYKSLPPPHLLTPALAAFCLSACSESIPSIDTGFEDVHNEP